MFRFGDPGGRGYGLYGTNGANMQAWWGTTIPTPSVWTISASGGRTTGSCITGSNTGAANAIRNLGVNAVTCGAAVAYKGTTPASATNTLFGFEDTGTSQVEVRINTSGNLIASRNLTVLGTSLVSLTPNIWYHIEMKALIDPSVGTFEVRLNGVTVIGPLTGQNTRSTANSYVNQFYMWPGGNNSAANYDDIIVWDGVANDPQGNPDIHDFIGDCGLTWLLPTGAGTTTQYTPLTSTNFSQVNEATPDGDTSYVSDATVGHLDTYAIANLGANISSVKSLAVVNYARKDDVGNRSFAPEIRTNSANFDGVTQALGNSYAYYFSNWGQNPSGTPANWTTTDVNALEAGQKTIA